MHIFTKLCKHHQLLFKTFQWKKYYETTKILKQWVYKFFTILFKYKNKLPNKIVLVNFAHAMNFHHISNDYEDTLMLTNISGICKYSLGKVRNNSISFAKIGKQILF